MEMVHVLFIGNGYNACISIIAVQLYHRPHFNSSLHFACVGIVQDDFLRTDGPCSASDTESQTDWPEIAVGFLQYRPTPGVFFLQQQLNFCAVVFEG